MEEKVHFSTCFSVKTFYLLMCFTVLSQYARFFTLKYTGNLIYVSQSVYIRQIIHYVVVKHLSTHYRSPNMLFITPTLLNLLSLTLSATATPIFGFILFTITIPGICNVSPIDLTYTMTLESLEFHMLMVHCPVFLLLLHLYHSLHLLMLCHSVFLVM